VRILLIGGTGFIGTHLCERLCLDNQVVVIARHKHMFCPEFINVNYIWEDWRALDYKNFFLNNKFDKVILIDWSGHPRSSNVDTLSHFELNAVPSIKIIDALMKYTSAEVFFLSSFGALPELNSGFNKQTMSGYAAAKFSVEAHLEAYSSIYGRRCASFRISNPYGRYQNFKGSQGIIPIVVYKAFLKEAIPIFPGFDISKDYISVEKAVQIITDDILCSDRPRYSLVPVCSGHLYTAIDILAHVNFVVPLIDLVPEEYVVNILDASAYITSRADEINYSYLGDFDDEILEIVEWVSKWLPDTKTIT
jgi:UDP-glucose 4-epimerase